MGPLFFGNRFVVFVKCSFAIDMQDYYYSNIVVHLSRTMANERERTTPDQTNKKTDISTAPHLTSLTEIRSKRACENSLLRQRHHHLYSRCAVMWLPHSLSILSYIDFLLSECFGVSAAGCVALQMRDRCHQWRQRQPDGSPGFK